MMKLLLCLCLFCFVFSFSWESRLLPLFFQDKQLKSEAEPSISEHDKPSSTSHLSIREDVKNLSSSKSLVITHWFLSWLVSWSFSWSVLLFNPEMHVIPWVSSMERTSSAAFSAFFLWIFTILSCSSNSRTYQP